MTLDIAERSIPLLLGDLRPNVDGHTEIVLAFRLLEAKYPGVRRYELQFDPPPWTSIGAQRFIHVPNEELENLHAMWEKQLDKILQERGSKLVQACRTHEPNKSELAELADIKRLCPHHRAPPGEFKSNGENCDICGTFI